jgi:hypothetical protein
MDSGRWRLGSTQMSTMRARFLFRGARSQTLAIDKAARVLGFAEEFDEDLV